MSVRAPFWLATSAVALAGMVLLSVGYVVAATTWRYRPPEGAA